MCLIFLNFENKRKLLKAFEIKLKIKYNKTNKSIGELVMAVKDFMTRKVVYISPDTTIAHAADIRREQGLHRLPVIENDQLVGLVTEGTIA